jgi:hypothetical protein
MARIRSFSVMPQVPIVPLHIKMPHAKMKRREEKSERQDALIQYPGGSASGIRKCIDAIDISLVDHRSDQLPYGLKGLQ